eukprot:1507764-Pleurochrysis_carterae.AAC.4
MRKSDVGERLYAWNTHGYNCSIVVQSWRPFKESSCGENESSERNGVLIVQAASITDATCDRQGPCARNMHLRPAIAPKSREVAPAVARFCLFVRACPNFPHGRS